MVPLLMCDVRTESVTGSGVDKGVEKGVFSADRTPGPKVMVVP